MRTFLNAALYTATIAIRLVTRAKGHVSGIRSYLADVRS